VAIHGNKSQTVRTKALAGFKTREVRVLVATDIAARGLDIKLLPYVVNFDLPNVPEDYVHRIGRTARAGHNGHAISLVQDDERGHLKAIEKLLDERIAVGEIKGVQLATEAANVDDRPPLRHNNRSKRPAQGNQGSHRGNSNEGHSRRPMQNPNRSHGPKKAQGPRGLGR